MKKTLAVAARVFSMSPLYNNQLMDTVYPTYTRMILGRPNHILAGPNHPKKLIWAGGGLGLIRFIRCC